MFSPSLDMYNNNNNYSNVLHMNISKFKIVLRQNNYYNIYRGLYGKHRYIRGRILEQT